MNRRAFLQGMLATASAPFIARAGVLMPVRPIWATPALSPLEAFEQEVLRKMAEAVGIPYAQIAGSLEHAAYSSTRIALLTHSRWINPVRE